jgi:ribosomal protein S18 acetylase RimI-like enzyme
MEIFPAHRGAGIGRHLLETLQFDAAHARRPLRLSVRKSNPARRLYERLGFSPIGFAGDYIRMEWTPPPT